MNDITSIAKKYISTIADSGITVSSAYIFGSHAKGTYHDDSDIDICVVSQSFKNKDHFDEMIKLNRLSLKVDSRIEAVPFTQEELNDKYSTLAHEIRTYGISIPLKA